MHVALNKRFTLPSLIIGILILFPTTSFCAGNESGEQQRKGVSLLDIKFSSEGLLTGKTLIRFPCSVNALEGAFGKPDRTLELKYNTIIVWDNTGLLAYIKPGGDQAHAFSIALGPQGYAFWPRSEFTGKLEVDGIDLKKGSNTDLLKKAGFVGDKLVVKYWEKRTKGLLFTAESSIENNTILSVGLSVSEKKKDL